jgi:hypothetical protein
MVLKEIGATVKELQKAEKKQNRTFAKNQDVHHNENVKQNSNSERDGEYGTDLHAEGRLSDTDLMLRRKKRTSANMGCCAKHI